MTLTLKFVRESPSQLARLYENSDGARQWIPRSVCPATFKYPPIAGQLTVHDVTIADDWLAKNPFPSQPQKQFKL